MSRFLHRWCEAVLLALLVVAVLWKGGKSLESTWLFAGVSAALIIAQAFSLRQSATLPRRLWWPVMALLTWTFAAFMASSTRNYGFDELLRAAGFALLLCWAMREYAASANQVFAKRVARTLALAAYVACGVGVAVYALQPVNRFVGTFFDHRFHTDYWPNAWAQLCLLAWPAVVWALFSTEAGWKREQFTPARLAVHWLVVSFFVGGFLLSYSRAGFLAFSGQVVLSALLLLLTIRDRVDWKNLLVGVLTVMFLAMLWFSAVNVLRSRFHSVESVVAKATFTSAEGGSSFSERAEFWKQASSLAAQRPLAGWGPYSFRFVQPRSQTEVLATSDHAHNVFLKHAMELGLPAAALLALLWATVALQGWRTWKDWSRRRVAGSHLKFAMFIAFAGVAAHNLVDYNLQFIGILLPLCLAAAYVGLPPALKHSARRTKAQRLVECMLAVLVLVFAAQEGWYLLVSSRGRHAEAAGNAQEALTWYRRAEGALFTRDLFLSEAGLYMDAGQLDDAQRALDAYAALNAEDQRLWKLRGDLAELRKDQAGAVSNYQRAYELGKYNDIGISHLLLRARAGSPAKVTPEIDAWRPALERLMNDFGYAIEQNAHFISLSRNVEGLVETAKLMQRLYPGEAEAYGNLIERVEEKAADDRAKLTARPEGLLWNAK